MITADQHFIEVETPKADITKDMMETPKFTVKWQHLTLKANVMNTQTKQMEQKTILNGVNGFAQPGELLVIMGPSGAGKSSLLDCISGRNTNIEGSITISGQPWSKKLQRLTSYVMQDDLFYQTITVHEHLMFQARLRMGATHSVEYFSQRVNTVMEELGLMKSRDTLIGGATVRGISGGERKRLSLATEILTNPSMLFVDEPTSGLDSFMAETVVTQLRRIAQAGRTVIATIHQPSSELFALFDQLYLLSDGATVYHGKASESVQYFSSLGYQCPTFLNPSDYFMRQLVVMDKATDQAGVERLEMLKHEWIKHCSTSLMEPDSATYGTVINDTDQDQRLSVFSETTVLANRNAVRLMRDRLAIRAAVMQALYIAFLVGLIYLQLDLTQMGIQNFVGVFFFVSVNQTMIASIPTFSAVPMELPIVLREYKAGLYHLIAWYAAKNISELPLQIIMPMLYFTPIYLLIGIGHGFEVYFYMQVTIIAVYSCAVGMGYMVSCTCRSVAIAPIIGLMLFLPFLLFGGLLINSSNVPDYFVWIQYVSPIKYCYEALMKIYWNRVPTIPCNDLVQICSARTGAEVLASYSMQHRSALGDGLILLAINVSFRVVGFVALWSNVRSKK